MYKETPDETLRANSGKLFGDTSARVFWIDFWNKNSVFRSPSGIRGETIRLKEILSKK